MGFPFHRSRHDMGAEAPAAASGATHVLASVPPFVAVIAAPLVAPAAAAAPSPPVYVYVMCDYETFNMCACVCVCVRHLVRLRSSNFAVHHDEACQFKCS